MGFPVRRGLIGIILWLTACAPRGEIVVDPSAAGVGASHPVYVASMRDVPGARLEEPRFLRVDVSVPPDRAPGSIAYPAKDRAPDPATQFLITDGGRFADAQGFRRAVERDLTTREADDRDLALFVHGYNYRFSEGVYRQAQMAHDLQIPGIQAQFSWPSLGDPIAYAGDRDATLYSRDGLVETIALLSQTRGRGKLILVGHSMGAALLMESLRQIAIAGRRDVLDEIDGVVLLAPDIDIGVFRMQARAIGQLPQPFVIFTSQRDHALRLSALISDEPSRLGNLSDPRRVADLDVTLVDVGAFSSGYGHFNVAESPALIRILARTPDLDQALPREGGVAQGSIADAALRVERAAQVVLSPGYQRRR